MCHRMLVAALISAVLAACAGALLWFFPSGGGGPAVPAMGSPARGTLSFEERYATLGESVRLISLPFAPERVGFYHRVRPDQVEELPNGPDAMLVVWKDGQPRVQTATWGAGGPERGGFAMDTLVEHLLGYRNSEIDAVDGIKYLRFHGDIVLDADAPPEERLRGLERVAQGAGVALAIKEVEAEQPVAVLKGEWRLRPVEGSPPVGRDTALPAVEIYGAALDTEAEGRTPFAEGHVGALAGALSSHLRREVVIEAAGAPARVRWYYHYRGDGSPESGAAARDVDLVLKHVCEQTALVRSDTVRRARRLVIAQVSGPRLP